MLFGDNHIIYITTDTAADHSNIIVPLKYCS
jgi:hypothetical protein